MCDCHEKIKDYFWREKKGFDVEIEGVIPLDSRHGSFNALINVTYRIKKKNGDLCRNRVKTYAVATYCPFCGEKYEKEKDNIRDKA